MRRMCSRLFRSGRPNRIGIDDRIELTAALENGSKINFESASSDNLADLVAAVAMRVQKRLDVSPQFTAAALCHWLELCRKACALLA
jgi:arginyl-tRNA synthetase